MQDAIVAEGVVTPPLSYSSEKMHRGCPASFYRRSILREPMPEQDKTATVAGNIMDRQARVFFRNYRDTGKAEFRFFNPEDESFQACFQKFADDPQVHFGENAWAPSREKAWEKIIKMADKFSDTIIAENLTSGNEFILSEDEQGSTKFGTYDNPLVINDILRITGAFDLYCATKLWNPGRLIDFKASFTTKHLDPLQLHTYQLGIHKKWGYPVGMAGFLLLNQKKIHWEGYKPNLVKQAEERLTEAAKTISKGVFPYTPSKNACKFCPYKSKCPDVFVEEEKPKKENLLAQVPAETPDL